MFTVTEGSHAGATEMSGSKSAVKKDSRPPHRCMQLLIDRHRFMRIRMDRHMDIHAEHKDSKIDRHRDMCRFRSMTQKDAGPAKTRSQVYALQKQI